MFQVFRFFDDNFDEPFNLINLDFILIFISLYLVLYVFISHTKSLCEQLAIVNQKINSHSDE